MNETGEEFAHDAAVTVTPPITEPTLHGLRALGVAVPHEDEVRDYLRQHLDLLSVLHTAVLRLRAHFGAGASLSLELDRDPESPARILTLIVRQHGDQLALLRQIEDVTDAMDAELSALSVFIAITTDFTPPRDV